MGSYMLVLAALWIFRREEFERSAQALIASKEQILISGLFALVAGLAVVIGHPVWEWSWRVVITLIGYLAIFKGILRIGFPKEFQKILEKMLAGNHWPFIAFLLILGGFLVFHGFLL